MRDGHPHPIRRVLVLGATSEIAMATVAAMDIALNGQVVLAGRDRERLAKAVRQVPGGPATQLEIFDATDPASVVGVIERAFSAREVDVVLVAFGVLGDQELHEQQPTTAADALAVNVTGAAVALLECARRLREQGHGTLVVMSSMAAIRPRRTNAVYGAAKAAVDALARGLADSLWGSGARILLVRPGFVVGRMTAGLPEPPFATTPDDVGRAVVAALDRRGEVVWAPRRLRWIALAARMVPRAVWRRLPY